MQFTDQMGHGIILDSPPKRIISLVPSQTELLADLGLNTEVACITRFCVHPESWRERKHIVGGTKKFDFDAIDKIKPDLILGNKEENYKEGIDQLKSRYPVWMSDIVTLDDSFAMIRSVGLMTNREQEAASMVSRIKNEFTSVKKKAGSVLYLIWRKPWMAAGADTFIDTLLNKIGLENVIKEPRYPELTPEKIMKLDPDYVFLSSEPFPFKEKHIPEVKRMLHRPKVLCVDGEIFSWYGSRLLKAPQYFNNMKI